MSEARTEFPLADFNTRSGGRETAGDLRSSAPGPVAPLLFSNPDAPRGPADVTVAPAPPGSPFSAAAQSSRSGSDLL